MDRRYEVAPSYALSSALVEFRGFLVPDDAERSDVLEEADGGTLRDLVEAVSPLLPEIDGLLHRLRVLPHPLPDELEVLEYDLTSLGQAGREAQLVLLERGV